MNQSAAISVRADPHPAGVSSERPAALPSPEQVRIVQSTWLKVLPFKEAAAQLFYGRLFETDPLLKALFRGDLREQGDKLMQMMNTAVNGLSRLERAIPAIQELGRRHADYGVRNEHYGAVGTALLWTLAKGSGAEFTPEVKDAWATVYGMLAKTMQDAAATERARSAHHHSFGKYI